MTNVEGLGYTSRVDSQTKAVNVFLVRLYFIRKQGDQNPLFWGNKDNRGRGCKTVEKAKNIPEQNGKSGANRLKRDLMFFWGTHANSRFDEQTICYAVDGDPNTLNRELQALVNAGFIEREVNDGVISYCLTLNEGKRRAIMEWASPGHNGR